MWICTLSPCPRSRKSCAIKPAPWPQCYLPRGLDPMKCTVFIQSHVAAHAEGCWMLNCVTPLGWLERMTQYKDKLLRQESVATGLLTTRF